MQSVVDYSDGCKRSKDFARDFAIIFSIYSRKYFQCCSDLKKCLSYRYRGSIHVFNDLRADPCEPQYIELHWLHSRMSRSLDFDYQNYSRGTTRSSSELRTDAVRHARDCGHEVPRRPLSLAWAKSGERRAGSQF